MRDFADAIIAYLERHLPPHPEPEPHEPRYCDWCRDFGLQHRPGVPRYCCTCLRHHEGPA